jgi:hypothetical protein
MGVASGVVFQDARSFPGFGEVSDVERDEFDRRGREAAIAEAGDVAAVGRARCSQVPP